jgi:hypothetical protein
MSNNQMMTQSSDGHFFQSELISVPEPMATTNPFFLKEIPDVEEMEKKQLYQKYDRVLIMCSCRDDPEFNYNLIVDPTITLEYLSKAVQNLKLLIGDIKMLHIMRHKIRSVIVSKSDLEPFNHQNIPLNDTEIVIMMPYHNEQYAMLYRNLFSPCQDHNSFVAAIVLTTLYDSYWHDDVKKGLEHLRSCLNDTNFWTQANEITNNEGFMNRIFKFKGQMSDKIRASALATNKLTSDSKTVDVIKKIEEFGGEEGNDYLRYLYRKDLYLDASDACKKRGRKLFHLNEKPHLLTKEQITELFNLVKSDEQMLYTIFNTFAISKDLCHLVTHNKEVLKIMNPLFKKYASVYRYLLGYPILVDYISEGIKKTFVKQTDNCIFTIDEAHNLPFFPFSNNPKLSPYFPVMVSDELLDVENNLMGIKIPKDVPEHWITDLAGFKKRFNVFTTGKSTHSIFDGMNWDGLAITGSVISACCLEETPLLKKILLRETFDQMYGQYFDEYYTNSDIDMVCTRAKSIFDFMDKAYEIHTNVKYNLDKLNTDGTTLEIIPHKTVGIVVTTDYIEKYMKEYEVNWLIKNIENSEVKERFNELYVTNKYRQNKQFRQYLKENNRVNPLYDTFFKPQSIDAISIHIVSSGITRDQNNESDNEIYFYRSEIEERDLSPEENTLMLKISESIKFKIESPQLRHNIELFRAKYGEPFSCVSRFHLGCVRGYYVGGANENVYLMPSAVCALMTMINPDYKYFAGTNDPIKIINKNRMRGWGTILNDREKINVIEYNSNAPEWSRVFNLDPKDKESVKSHFGFLSLESEIFKPSKHFKGLPESEIYQDTLKTEYFETEADLVEYYRKLGYDEDKSFLKLLKLQSIGEDGYVSNLQPAILDLMRNLMKTK